MSRIKARLHTTARDQRARERYDLRMDKASEHQLLRLVFGDFGGLHVEPSERPDFLVTNHSNHILGVEVTQLHRSSAVAKLTHCRGYSDGLLEGTSRIHQRDVGHFKVDRITILEKSGEPFTETTAIIQSMPPFSERLELLFSCVAGKEAKAPVYLRHCEMVDLVIRDQDNLFYHSTFDELLGPLSQLREKTALISSLFREIYLVTFSKVGEVCIPLKGACFLADCYAYGNLVGQAAAAEFPDGIESELYLSEIVACLRLEGYREIEALHRESSVEIRHGAWAFLCDGLDVTIHNCMTVFPWSSVSTDDAQPSPNVFHVPQKAEGFYEKRQSIYSVVPIEMRVRR